LQQAEDQYRDIIGQISRVIWQKNKK
jgi:hypothetical protein